MTIFLDGRKTAGPYDHFSPKTVGLGTENLVGEGPAVLLKRSLAGKILEGISGYQKNGRFQVHLEASQIVENLPPPFWSQKNGQKLAFLRYFWMPEKWPVISYPHMTIFNLKTVGLGADFRPSC